jgi:hypothetical protein
MYNNEIALNEELRRQHALLIDRAGIWRNKYMHCNVGLADIWEKEAAEMLRLIGEGSVKEKQDALNGPGGTYKASSIPCSSDVIRNRVNFS